MQQRDNLPSDVLRQRWIEKRASVHRLIVAGKWVVAWHGFAVKALNMVTGVEVRGIFWNVHEWLIAQY